jgi:exosortase/archaeosortase family protein
MVMKDFFKRESSAWFWFLVKITLFYLAINYFFVAYTGLTIGGGRLYSRFLAEHLDFISLFRRFLLRGGALFASLIGYPSDYNDYILYVKDGSAVRMVYSCLGFGLMSAYAALVLAWPAKALHRIISLVLGTIIIIVLNMIRLGGLAVLYTTRHYGFFEYINHHDLFNIIVLVAVFIMFVIHLKYSESKYTGKID